MRRMCGEVPYLALVYCGFVPLMFFAACATESTRSDVWPDSAVEQSSGEGDLWSSADTAADRRAGDRPRSDASSEAHSPDFAGTDSVWVICLEDDSCRFLDRPKDCILGRCVDGSCQGALADDGWVCTTDSVCRPGGLCQAGVCQPYGTHICDDGNPCTEDLCDDQADCLYVPRSDTACDDGNPCTQAGICVSGTCQSTDVTCDDGNPCTADLCDLNSGCLYPQQDGPCSDGDLCTEDDRCQFGFCVPGRNICQCAVDDDCRFLPAEDRCVTGVRCDTDSVPSSCVITQRVDCSTPQDPCMEASCDSASGLCIGSPLPDGVSCDAPLMCVQEGTCQQGECVGDPSQCDDGLDCTDDVCEPGMGCQFVSSLTVCDDGNPCTVNDMCSSQGLCVGLSTGCGTAPAVLFRISSLSVLKPAMCLPSIHTLLSSCASANGLVDSLIAGWLQPSEVGRQILLEFSPFDFAASPVSLTLGTGQCQETPEGCSCQFQALTGTLDETLLMMDSTCRTEDAPASADAPCFLATSEYFEFPLGATVLPLFSPHLVAHIPTPNHPASLMHGRALGFLRKASADLLTIALPMMPAVPLAHLLDPSTLTFEDGNEGWAVDLRFHALVVSH